MFNPLSRSAFVNAALLINLGSLVNADNDDLWQLLTPRRVATDLKLGWDCSRHTGNYMDRSNNMAATDFMAPLFVLFLFTTSKNKWNACTGNGYERVQGIPEFKFSTLLSQEEGIPLGYEMLIR